MKNTDFKPRKKIRVLQEVLLRYRPERIYLFGSWARGEEDDLSDLDVVVIKRTNKPFFTRLRETARLIPPELEGVDILVYTPAEYAEMKREGNALAELITEEGIVIYDRQTKS